MSKTKLLVLILLCAVSINPQPGSAQTSSVKQSSLTKSSVTQAKTSHSSLGQTSAKKVSTNQTSVKQTSTVQTGAKSTNTKSAKSTDTKSTSAKPPVTASLSTSKSSTASVANLKSIPSNQTIARLEESSANTAVSLLKEKQAVTAVPREITLPYSPKLIDVTDQTIRLGGGKKEELMFGFAAGDKIIFNFQEENSKDLKEIEIIEYPTLSRFSDYKTSRVKNKEIIVNQQGVFIFRLKNSSLAKRICKLKIQRVPASAATERFNSSVSWINKQDTIWQ